MADKDSASLAIEDLRELKDELEDLMYRAERAVRRCARATGDEQEERRAEAYWLAQLKAIVGYEGYGEGEHNLERTIRAFEESAEEIEGDDDETE
jgi:hypothetical protein